MNDSSSHLHNFSTVLTKPYKDSNEVKCIVLFFALVTLNFFFTLSTFFSSNSRNHKNQNNYFTKSHRIVIFWYTSMNTIHLTL